MYGIVLEHLTPLLFFIQWEGCFKRNKSEDLPIQFFKKSFREKRLGNLRLSTTQIFSIFLVSRRFKLTQHISVVIIKCPLKQNEELNFFKMKKFLLLTKLMVLTAVMSVNAQINFEELEMPTYKNGSNGAGKFQSGEASFINYYNTEYNSWSGFAVSKASDTETSGFGNQYSSITGGGVDDENFMVTCIGAYNGATYIKLSASQNVTSIKVTNNTYAYNSMRDGDNFAKKFGGETGNDPDYFLLSVIGYNNNERTDSIGFYLADFQSEDNAEDYIINTWESMSLSELGSVDSLTFELTSSDNSDYGMNTPAYFCLDNLALESGTQDFSEYDFDYWNGEDLTGNFTSQNIEFGNTFTPSAYGGYWTGFAYSRKTDNLTSGYGNQYSAITGEGYNGSDNYLVGNGTPEFKFAQASYIESIQITNSTYAYNSMRDGDSFAKIFGSTTDANGEDDGTNGEDWFLLSIKGYNNGVYTNTVDFYLADFRADNDDDDYIVNTWKTVDLSSLNLVDSLSFSLTSSDNGDYGMNTPAYFCLDNIKLNSTAVLSMGKPSMAIFPNPSHDFVRVKANYISQLTITDLSGKKVYSQKVNSSSATLDVSSFKTGVYILSVQNNDEIYNQKLIIK